MENYIVVIVKAEILNDQFKSVCTPNAQEDLNSIQSDLFFPSIDQLYICQKGVTKLLKELKINSASGPDNIANRVLKQCAEELSPVLTFIFGQSLANGELPEDWLKANAAENYRPVSQLFAAKLLNM